MNSNESEPLNGARFALMGGGVAMVGWGAYGWDARYAVSVVGAFLVGYYVAQIVLFLGALVLIMVAGGKK